MKFKRILSGLLAAALTLATPLTALAVEGNASGNNGAGAVTSSGGDFSANIADNGNGMKSGKIGIRLKRELQQKPLDLTFGKSL